jgi:hypothetical protein
MAPWGQSVYLIIVVFYYDPRKVSEFLDSIARGFVSSPLQYALFGGIILLLVAGLFVAYRVQRGRARRQEGRLERERFERLAAKLGLGGSELEALDLLAGGRLDRKLRLLTSPAAFNRAAARLADGRLPESSLAELRLKLGFQASNPERAPSASSELPEGLPVLLLWSAAGARRRLAARVVAQEPEALVLALSPGQSPPGRAAQNPPGRSPPEAAGPPPGSPVTVVFQNRAGVFSFRTRLHTTGGLHSAEGGVLRLDQVERLERTQRRQYYRRRLRLPVQVQAREGEPPLASQLLDLGGEGASLANPGRSLSAGDLAELSFRVGGESFRLAAEVLRVSRDGQVLHVHFHGLREADRDRLLGTLFRSLGEAAR